MSAMQGGTPRVQGRAARSLARLMLLLVDQSKNAVAEKLAKQLEQTKPTEEAKPAVLVRVGQTALRAQ